MSGRKKIPILHRTTSEKMVPTDVSGSQTMDNLF